MFSREKIYLQLTLVFCCLVCCYNTANAQLYINELMASNSTTIADESGDFDDWIEIYNAGSSDVNLADYYISDDPTAPTLWQIPATNAALTTVPAGGFLLLWADKDLADGANHINLKLSSNGETLVLLLPDGSTQVDAVTFGAQNTDISYGRTEDGMSAFQTFPQSTPGLSNSTNGPSTYPATFVFPVTSYTDDAEEAADGTMKLNSPDLDMTDDGSSLQTIGIRFTDIEIEQGATITNAYIQFTTFQTSVGACDLTISGQDDSNPNTFAGADFDMTNRPLTNSSADWSPEVWAVDGETGDEQKTSNIANIVQELVDNPSWNTGNAMAFIIEGVGTRAAFTYDGDTELVPRLVVEVALLAPTEPIVDLYINEIAARGTDYADEFGDFEDWVELYNGGTEPIEVGGLYLTDDTDELLKWQIGTPAVIDPNDHLIIWTDSDPEEGPLHTNFKLSGSGATLSLVQVLDNAVSIIDQITFGDIPLKATYGRTTDGDNSWVLFGEITPDAPNDGADLWIAPPSFSLDNGVYTGAQTLSLSHPESGVEIRYTTDGSDPTEWSSLYNNSITISDNQAVKAIAIKSGYANSRPGLRSYLIDTPLNLPTLFLTSDPDNFFSDESGIYVVGTNGVPGYCSNNPRNWANDDWERPANLTLFETDGTEAFNVNIGVQIGGACSRNFDLKGLNIYLREKEYGDANLNYQLYKGRDHNNYYRFKLRNSGQDFVRMGFRDGLIQTMLWDKVDLDLQGFQPTVMYLNGEYWGIHNIRENFNDEYFETNYDVKSDEIDLIKSPALSWQEVKKGDDLNYMSLFNYIDNNDLSIQTNYDYVEERIDMSEFTNYWITMAYTANYDWPANNIIVWRERKSSAKWRWAVLDTDGSTANGLTPQADFDFNTLEQITDPNSTSWPNHQNSTLFLRGLLENQEFRDEYIQRNCSFMELVFNPDRVNMMTDSIQNMFLPEVDAHIAKWGSGNAMGSNYWSWLGWVDDFREFFVERPAYFRGFMDDYFNLNGTYDLSVIYDLDTGGDVFVNRNTMDIPYDYVGTYFKGVPLRVSAVAKPGFTFSHWLETGETTAVIDFVSWTNTTLTPIFTENSFSVNLGNDIEICAGESITLDATVPGCNNCNYIWEDDSTNPIRVITPTSTDDYAVTVTGGNNESAEDDISITVNELPSTSASSTNISCYGAQDGTIDLSVANGSSPYQYSWSNQGNTQDLSGLNAGTFSVTVTDNNGCTSTESLDITEPNELNFSIASENDISCFSENNGSIDINVSNGTAPYNFLWSNGATTEDISNLSAGNYTVTITEYNNCETIESFTIDQPTEINLVANTANINCFGNTDGEINLSVNGGTGNYNFAWNNGATSQNIVNLNAGAYTVTVTDANLCESIETYEITEPAALQATPLPTTLNCFNDTDASILLDVVGGTIPYNYLWNTGATTQNIDNLVGGTYSVTITDNNDCEVILSNIQIDTPNEIISDFDVIDINCFGEANGQIQSNVSGGNGNLNYLWNTGATTANLLNLSAGTYILTITDAQGCEVIEETTLLAPTALNINQTMAPISCNGFSDSYIQLSVSGGTGAYTFLWNTGATTSDLYNLGAGFYEVTISDVNGCQEVAAYTITEPDVLDPQTSVIDVSCDGVNNGSIQTNSTGGTAPYNYNWSTGATTQNISNLTTGGYFLTLTDANNCQITNFYSVNEVDGLFIDFVPDPISCFGANDATLTANISGGTGIYSYLWNTGATNETIENLSPGFYQLTVVDNGNCEAEQVFEITEPTQITGTANTLMAICGNENGSISVSPEGGSTPYTYLWNTGATSANISNLAGGTYNLTITDNNGCEFTLSETVMATDGVDVSSTDQSVSCFGNTDGSISLLPTGGNGSYFYSWSTGATTQEISGLPAGIYNTTVTDGNNCETTYTVELTEPDILSNAAIVQNVSCFENADGSIELTPTGGTNPYNFLWSNGSTFQNIADLASGDYFLTLTDVNGCEQLDSFSIAASDTLEVNIVTTTLSCYGYSDASVDLDIISGGTPPFNYDWSNGATGSSVDNLSAGIYAVSITDANECLNTQTIEIGEPDFVTVDATITDPNGGIDNGIIELTTTGGTAPYSFLWNTGATTPTIENLPPGTYTVSVTDANNCIHIVSYTLSTNSIEDLIGILSLDIYPNPSDGQFQIVVESKDVVSGQVTVYNVLGQVFFNGMMEGSRLEMAVDLKSASAGVYFVQLEIDGAVVVRKVVVGE